MQTVSSEFIGVLVGLALLSTTAMAVTLLHNAALRRELATLRAGMRAVRQTLGQATEPMAPIIQGPQEPWHTVPGGRIELRDTGWCIRLGKPPAEPLYSLITPEGQLAATSADLEALKRAAERLAAERQQFVLAGAATDEARRALQGAAQRTQG